MGSKRTDKGRSADDTFRESLGIASFVKPPIGIESTYEAIGDNVPPCVARHPDIRSSLTLTNSARPLIFATVLYKSCAIARSINTIAFDRSMLHYCNIPRSQGLRLPLRSGKGSNATLEGAAQRAKVVNKGARGPSKGV